MSKEEIKNNLIKRYPNIEINNEYFFEEKVFNDFTLDIIATKLVKLTSKQAFNLYMHVYAYGNANCIKEMLKYIVKENTDYFINDNEDIYKDMNIIKEYTRLYKGKDFTIEELKNIDIINLENNSNKNNRFISFDINYYNELIIIQKLYSEKKIKYNDILLFIEFTFEMLKNNFIKEYGNYDSKYDNYINEIISHLLIGNITPDTLFDSMNNSDKIKNLLIAGKFKTLIYQMRNIPIDIVYTLNGKNINNIYNDFLKIPELDKIKKNYSEGKIKLIITNMTILLGSDNVSKIIRHLPYDYLKVDRLFRSFLGIDLTNVKTNNKNITYNNEFINLFMGDNINEPNSLLNLIYEGKTVLADKIESIYAYWDILDARYKVQPLNTKLSFLEKEFSNSKVILNPDEYLLEGDIINSYYDNRQFQGKSNINLIEDIRKVYKGMKHNYQKTIPYVSGIYENYYYETIRANDPSLFIMGSVSGCCFKIGGDADSFVRYCADDVNGRVIAIKNNSGKIVAMAPIVRNGNLILCNSIESNMVHNNAFMYKMFKILEEAGNKILDISSKNESLDDRLKIMLVGSYKNDLSEYSEYRKISYGMIDNKCLSPLDGSIYVNMGGYDWDNYVIASSENVNLSELRSFNSKVIYDEPRKEVLEVERENINGNIEKLISSIYYEKTGKLLSIPTIEKVIFNEDWFILIDNKYNYISAIVGNDPRAHEEFEEYLSLTKEHISYFDKDGHIKDDAKYNYGR